ncbi:methyltransferase [Flavobacterium ardleyense]|uniref:methyltransferase n=1 Tax=Flavobacterium ardleyense TaxID=2038737 RepID=UPI00298CE6FC|nr:methyltransferase [Flavobacterium ardleyense]
MDKSFWESRWQEKNTGWDIGYANPAISNFMEQYPNKGAAILIAGCGNAYEAEFLLKNGFTNITLIDIAETAVKNLQEKFKVEKSIRILCEDYFEHNDTYDVLIEQTFFCAINPIQRADYAQKAHSLLNDNGILMGVLFNREFDKAGPPFGGTAEEYLEYFKPYFDLKIFETCHSSVPQRQGSELFIHLIKK